VVVGNVLIGASLLCIAIMAVAMIILWRTYDPSDIMDSLTLRQHFELMVPTYMIPAAILAAIGLVLRRGSTVPKSSV